MHTSYWNLGSTRLGIPSRKLWFRLSKLCSILLLIFKTFFVAILFTLFLYKDKISLWTCQASDAQSPDNFEGAAEVKTDSVPTPCASLSAPSPGLTALCRLPTMVCTSSELSFASVTTCTCNIFHSEFNLMGRGHLAAMIRSSRRLPFFSQLESATSWSRDSPLPDGTHLDASWI